MISLESFLKDLKHSLRMFLQSPGFTFAAVAALEELHLSPPIAAALTRLGWSADDALTREDAPCRRRR